MTSRKTHNTSCPSRRCPCEGCLADRATYRRNLRRSQGVKEVRAMCGSPGMWKKGCHCDLCVANERARSRHYYLTGTTLGAPQEELFDETYGGLLEL